MASIYGRLGGDPRSINTQSGKPVTVTSVPVSGRVQHNRYTDRTGTERLQRQVIADNLVSARTVRPSGPRKAAAKRRSAAGDDLDDEIPPF